MKFSHLRIDVARIRLLLENESHTIHALLQRYCPDSQGFSFQDYRFLRLYHIKFDIEGGVAVEIFEYRRQLLFPLLKGMYRYVTSRTSQSESPDQSRQTENMVAVKVGKKDMAQFCEGETLAHKAELGSLATINHIEAATMVHDRG